MYFVTVFIKPAPGSSSTVWSGPGLGESLLLTRPAAASARCMPPTTPSMAMNRLPMIDSLEYWKPSDHLGIKIARIGLPLLGPVSPDERRRERLAIHEMNRRCRCRSPDLV